MENQQNNQLQPQNNQLALESNQQKSLMIAMEAGNNRQIATILKQYKTQGGDINYPAVMSVPLEERLPALFKNDFMKGTALVVGALAMAFEKLSFKSKKNEVGVLVNNIAEEILNSCDEDNLSLEDLVLFLQNLVRGKYGVIE